MSSKLYQLQILYIMPNIAFKLGRVGCSEIAIIKVMGRGWEAILKLQLTSHIDLAQNLTITETDGGALRLSIQKLHQLLLLLLHNLTIATV